MSEPIVVGIHVCGNLLRRAELRRLGQQCVIATSEEPLPAARAPAPSAAGVPAGFNSAPSAQIDGLSCVAALPTAHVLSRGWSFPDTDREKLRRMVAHRLEADLPVALEQLTWGFRPADRHAAADAGYVFVQAARTEQVARHLAALESAGVHVDVLTTEAEALGALYRHGLTLRPVDGGDVLVLAAAEDWLVGVFRAGKLHSLRRVHVAPERPDLAARQAQQSIGAQVRRVLWCAPPEHAGAARELAERLGASVELVEAAVHLVGLDGAPVSAAQLATFGPAIGLALAGEFERDEIIRFFAREVRAETPQRQRWQRLLAHPWRWAAAAAGLLILATILHVGALRWETGKMRRLVAEADQAGSPLAALQPKIRALQRVQTYRVDVEGLMAELCRPVPDGIILSSIQLSRDGRLVIKGISGDPGAIFTLADALRKSARFAGVNPERTEPGQGGAFTISADLVGVSRLPSFATRGGR